MALFFALSAFLYDLIVDLYDLRMLFHKKAVLLCPNLEYSAHMVRRIHSILLLLALLIGSAGMNYVQAAVYNGGCGAVGNEVNVTWAVNTETGVLSISGTGAMADYDGFNNKKAPWDGWHTYITSIVVNNGVTRIGNWSFYYLINATSVSLPNSVTEIGDYCFRQCTFTTITLPNKLKKIGTYAFHSCGGLTSITIPSTVTGLSTGVFYGCTNLKDIYLPWTTSASIPTYPSYFVSDQSKVTLHVGCGYGSLYRATTGWKNFTIVGPSKYKLTVTSANSAQGTVKIGNGTAGASVSQSNTYCETAVQITAVPVAHYHFSKWNDNNTSNPRTIYMPGANTTYTASFAIDQHTLTVISSNTNYGTVSGGGTYNYNTKVTITATPKTGYHFSKWSDNNTNASRQVTVTGNATYSASFAANQYTLTVNSNNTNYGTVSGGGIYNYNTKATLTATPKTGYHFVKWNDNNTNASRQITVTANATYTANFAITNYTITAKTNNSSLGTVSGGGTYQEGKTATLTATPANCTSAFVQWNDGNTDNPRSFTVTENKTLTAQFVSLTGNCGANGNNLTWAFNRCTGVLTISGSGAMADWSAEADVPWYNYRESITSVVLPYGLTHIGDYAFRKTSITKIDLPSALQTIGKYAFSATPLIEVCIPEGVTSIGEKAFISGSEYACLNEACNAPLRRVYLPSTLTELGNASIALAHLEYLTYPKSITTLGHTYYHQSKYPAKELYASWTTNVPSRTGPIATVTTPKQQMHIPYGTTAAYRAKDWARVHDLVEDVDERAIDLGLSIRWASCNVGATAPEENGEYYMWADTLGGWSSYVKANHPYYKNNQYTRYNSTDHRTRLIPFDDAAYIRWGETWRMPTKDEWHELFTQCTWEKEKLNDKWVYKVTGPNGNYIYIPLPGYKYDISLFEYNDFGTYWASELYSSGSPIATSIGGSRNSGPADPSYGRSVRAVYRREWPSFTLTITDTPEGTSYTKAVNAGSTYTLTAQEDDCHTFVRWSDGNTNKTRTVTAISDAVYTAEYNTIQYTVTVQSAAPEMGDVMITIP